MRMSARIQSGNGTMLESDDETVDSNGDGASKGSANRANEIELRERGLSMWDSRVETKISA